MKTASTKYVMLHVMALHIAVNGIFRSMPNLSAQRETIDAQFAVTLLSLSLTDTQCETLRATLASLLSP